MFRPERIFEPPSNLNEFIAEIQPALDGLYGPRAGEFYGKTALEGIRSTILNPLVYVYGSMAGDQAGCLLFARRDGARVVISFFHSLRQRPRIGLGEALLDFALADGETFSGAIVTEFVPFDEGPGSGAFARHGFSVISRQLMRSPAAPYRQVCRAGVNIEEDLALEKLASVLVESYLTDTQRFLFPEVYSTEMALTFLQRVQRGEFGRHVTSYTLSAQVNGDCAGFITGCEVLPGVGFVLHLAVHPSAQRRGIGSALLAELCHRFAREGLDYIALGVTCDNPAVNLYKKAGFEPVTQVPVFYRL